MEGHLSCPDCLMGFKEARRLNEHRKRAHGKEKDRVCSYCKKE